MPFPLPYPFKVLYSTATFMRMYVHTLLSRTVVPQKQEIKCPNLDGGLRQGKMVF